MYAKVCFFWNPICFPSVQFVQVPRNVVLWNENKSVENREDFGLPTNTVMWLVIWLFRFRTSVSFCEMGCFLRSSIKGGKRKEKCGNLSFQHNSEAHPSCSHSWHKKAFWPKNSSVMSLVLNSLWSCKGDDDGTLQKQLKCKLSWCET